MQTSRSQALVPCLVVAAALLGAPLAAQDAPTGALPRLEVEMGKIQLNIGNAKTRLKNGVVALSPDPASPRTPAFLCCEANLKRIGKRMAATVRILSELDLCYEAQANADGQIQVGILRSDLESLARALEAFAKAADASQTAATFGAVQKAFLLMRESADALTPCSLPGNGR